MSDSPSESEVVIATGTVQLPGKRLRQAREAAGLSVMDVAQQLHLSPNVITSLEADDYADLAGTTYVAGYLRSYARRLNLDESDITAHLSQTPQPSEAIVLDTVEPIRTPRRSRKALVTVVVLVILLGLLAVAAWLLSQSSLTFSAHTSLIETTIPAPVVKDESDPTTTYRKITLDLPDDSTATAASDDESETVESVAADAVTESQVAQEETTTAAAGIDADTAPRLGDTRMADAPAVDTAIPIAGGDASDEATPTDEMPAEVPIETAALEMAFHTDSWTEVRDSRGKLLVFRMVKAGSLLELAGTPPISVVLGYAPGVTITYNDRPFDLSAHTRHDVARFKVGVAP